ncbi:sulfatase-like hydrolase/transferase [Rhabdobacter roseus]|uniref:Arylsulfatase A-like enzyme n=1 Tax=Rhabdobacter roseus TaxID=1655419 RepID=A0A840TX26_9BACT|nr:arylsulfatase [Rhabdobacter roseus]MBB5287485.1 arylsulfatase A-like enzyme [Rhabdobacter roseus]
MLKQVPPFRARTSAPLLLSLLLLACTHPKATTQHPPNILYILADDLGYGDLSVYNPEGKIRTPHLDRLAAEGMRFTDAHSPSSVCTPTRYALLTGRYPWRSRLPVGVLRGYSRSLIEPDRLTVPALLHKAGYHTGMVGKWHLGVDWASQPAYASLAQQPLYGIQSEMDPEHIDFAQPPLAGPRQLGFDATYFLPASLDMPPYCYLQNDQLTELPTAHTEGNSLESGYTGPFWRAGLMAPSFDFGQVLPTFTRQAQDFLRRQSSARPFFLYLALAAPHTPWVPSEQYRGQSGAGEYGDFVQMVDAQVGQVLRTLDSLRLSSNTLVIFTSDNGPFWRPAFSERFGHRAAGKLRGMKGDIYEGGHRVPFLVRWPGKVKPGTVSDAPTTLANLLATCADLLGVPFPEESVEDSYSILPVLLGRRPEVPHQPAIVHSASNGFYAIRRGPWKLIEGLGSGGFTEPRVLTPQPGQPTGQLYNLEIDPAESQDLYQKYPEQVQELTTLLNEIRASTQRVKL